MRLNRQTAIFIGLLVIAIVVSVIFLGNDGDGETALPTVAATEAITTLFPGVQVANMSSITVSGNVEVGDTRPTPIPGNPTLEPPTPLPEGVEPATTTESNSLVRDETGAWTFAITGAAVPPTDTVDSLAVDTALQTLAAVRSNQQFVPEDGDYAPFGLDTPSYDITFAVAPAAPALTNPTPDAVSPAEAQTFRLRIGDRTVGGNGFYAQLNDDNETIYILTNAAALETSVLSLASNVPLVAPPTPTPAPFLNVPGPVFNGFMLNTVTNFTFTNNDTGDVITLTRDPVTTEWVFNLNGEILPVLQPNLQVALNTFGTIQGVQRTTTDNLASLGLDMPAYTLTATDPTRTYTLQLGDQDPTETIYYSLVDQFTDVVLIDETSVQLLLDLFTNPPTPQPAESTAEATAESTASAEMTAEATAEMTAEAQAEATSESTEAAPEMTAEATSETTAEMTEVAEMTAEATPMVEMTAEATEVMVEATPEMTEMVEMTEVAEMTAEATEVMVEATPEMTEMVEMTEVAEMTAEATEMTPEGIALMVPGLVFSELPDEDIIGFELVDAENGNTVSVSRADADSDWQVMVNDEAVPRSQAVLNVRLGTYSSIAALDVAEDVELADVGLDMPAITIDIQTDEVVYRVQLGDRVQIADDDIYYAIIEGQDEILLMDATSLDSLLTLLDIPE